jgi:hypothetical protein
MKQVFNMLSDAWYKREWHDTICIGVASYSLSKGKIIEPRHSLLRTRKLSKNPM